MTHAEFIPLSVIDEEDPAAPFLPDPDTVHWAKSEKPCSVKHCLTIWRCSHARCKSNPWSKRALFCRLVQRPLWGVVFLLGFLKILSLGWQGLIHLFPDDLDSALDAWAFPGARPSAFSHWTTHGVIPVACHSHNDYWRRVPLYSALAAGCISVEADIWLSGEELLVGHTRRSLSRDRTLRDLYLDPLLDMVQKHNVHSVDPSSAASIDGDDIAGVFALDLAQTLILLIDFKVDGELIWPHLIKQLEPLRQAGFLTHFNGSAVIQRPITVVASGDAPLHRILERTTHSDIFFDAPLNELTSFASPHTPTDPAVGLSPYNPHNSYYASVDFRKAIGSVNLNRFSQGQLAKLRRQVTAAHEQGLKVRYWGTPSWPRGLRNHVWHVLVREGVDVINVDDLRDATQQDWRKHRSWWN